MQTEAVRYRLFSAAVAFSALCVCTPVHSQSLGEVARQESERRKGAAPAKVYTNEDLSAAVAAGLPQGPPSAPAEVTPTEPSSTSKQSGRTVTEEDPVTHKVNVRTTAPPREDRDEQYWRVRFGEVRDKLARTTADLDAAQTNLAALDRAPKTPAIARERDIVATLVQRLQSEIRYRQLDVTKLQMYAEMNKVPAEWMR